VHHWFVECVHDCCCACCVQFTLPPGTGRDLLVQVWTADKSKWSEFHKDALFSYHRESYDSLIAPTELSVLIVAVPSIQSIFPPSMPMLGKLVLAASQRSCPRCAT
jgi:hypothetical protein